MKRFFASIVGAALVSAGMVMTTSAQNDRADVALRAAIETQTVKGDLKAAIARYHRIVEQYAGNRPVAAEALLRMAECYRVLGAPEAERLLQRLVAEYGDQQQPAAEARKRLASQRRPVNRGAYAQRELWSGTDLVTHLAPNAAIGFRARPSADGRWLVFPDHASHGDVALRDVATGEVRLITKEARGPNGFDWQNAQYALHPRLSADGSQVAYQWTAGGVWSIRICSTSGGRPRVLLQGDLFTSDIAWTPDGSALALMMGHARDGTDPHIAIISVSDGSITRIKSLPYRAGYRRPNAELGGFSPDGGHLVYATPNDTAPDQGIYAIARDGSNEAALVRGRSRDTSPVWAPNGNAVIFVSDRSANYGLWSVKVANGSPVGDPELLRGNVGPVQVLGFARDGSLFYGRTTSQDDVLVAELDPHGASVTPPALLVDSGIGANRGASWSPDGRNLAFVRSNGSEDIVIVRRPDGTEKKLPTRFSDGGLGFAIPSWLPDGHSLLVPDIDGSARRGVWRQVHIDTLQETVVLEGANWDMRRVTGPSPDGKYLYYSKGDRVTTETPSTIKLVRRDLATGAELELHRAAFGGSPRFYSAALSPDGRRLAFTVSDPKQAPTLMTVSTAGDEAPRQIIRSSFLPGAGDPDQTLQWSKDGRRILITSPERADIRRVWAFPVDGSEPQRLDLAFAQLRVTDLSSDGRLALSVRNVRPEIGVMTNLLGSLQARR